MIHKCLLTANAAACSQNCQTMDELIPTRATLLQRLKNWQDRSSWQDFFDTYWKLIYTIALKRGLTEAEAEDVVQETIISVAKHIPNFKYDPAVGSFKAWLLNMTCWRIADQIHKRLPLSDDRSGGESRSPDTSALNKLMDPESGDMDKLWNDEWKKQLFQAATDKVKRQEPDKFQIFDLYVNKEWPAGKVAKTFQVSVAQVYLAKHRIIEHIKAEVNRLEREVT